MRKMLGVQIFTKKFAWIVVILVLASLVTFFLVRQLVAQSESTFLRQLFGVPSAEQLEWERKQQIIEEVRAIFDLPDEVPSVAIITDVTELQNEPFFAKAKNGDAVLVYQSIQKAILYDPVAQKILDISEVTEDPPDLESIATTEPARVAIYNGTITAGKANAVAELLSSKFADSIEVSTGNAANTEYQETLVVLLADTKNNLAAEIAAELGVEIATAPPGESLPGEADILIIVGQDL